MTTAATSFLFSNASTRTRSSFGRSASASQMVDRLFSAALHRGSAQRSSDGAVTTATAAAPTSDRQRRDFTAVRVVVENAPPTHAARGAPVRLLDVPDRRAPAFDCALENEGGRPLVRFCSCMAFVSAFNWAILSSAFLLVRFVISLKSSLVMFSSSSTFAKSPQPRLLLVNGAGLVSQAAGHNLSL